MGPLAGVKVIELAGMGPAPFCGMLLGDMGADVLRIDRVERTGEHAAGAMPTRFEIMGRNKRSVSVDLKSPDGVAMLLDLAGKADIFIEPYRPGVAERLGIGPEDCITRNPALVYGRMTGWGQTGPLAARAGHDLNYIALAGALHGMGRPDEPPPPPLNLVGDFGGGALYLAYGLICALFESRRSGKGQVIDAAMIDGVASLTTIFHGFTQAGMWSGERGRNMLDGSAPFYASYETSDGRYITIAPIEPRFHSILLTALGLEMGADQYDQAGWPEQKQLLASIFRTRTRAEWEERLAPLDACFASVLSPTEAPLHPHHMHRGTFETHWGVTQPAPAPRLSRTAGAIRRAPPEIGEHSIEALGDWGIPQHAVDDALLRGAVVQRCQ